jgi:hypothetical protein
VRGIVFPVLSMIALSFTSFEAHASTAQQIEVRIKRIESGLLPPVLVKDDPATLQTLAERMQATHTPGISGGR